MDVYVYKSRITGNIYIHDINIPVFRDEGIHYDILPRIEVTKIGVAAYLDGISKVYRKDVPWIVVNKLYKCKLIEGKLL